MRSHPYAYPFPSADVASVPQSAPAVDKGKGRADDTRELEDFFEVLSRAQRPRLPEQRATLSADTSSRLRKIEASKTREANNVSLHYGFSSLSD